MFHQTGASLPPGCFLDPPEIDPELWAACAGPLFTVPSPNSLAVYCPQGHAEHVSSQQDAAQLAKHFPLPSQIFCRVLRVTAKTSIERDDLSVHMLLQPIHDAEMQEVKDAWAAAVPETTAEDEWPPRKWGNPRAVWKVLSKSDAFLQGGLSLPQKVATNCLPPLLGLQDMDQELPNQIVQATDIFHRPWKFRHVYRGSPKRHLLSTNWNRFLLDKHLEKSDRVVFLGGPGGSVKVGIRRGSDAQVRTGPSITCQQILQMAVEAETQKRPFEVTHNIRSRCCGNPIFVVPLDMYCKSLKQTVLLKPQQKVKFSMETAEFSIRRFTVKPRPVVVSGELRQALLSQSLDLRKLSALWRCVEVEWKDSDRQGMEVTLPSQVSPWEILPVDMKKSSGIPKNFKDGDGATDREIVPLGQTTQELGPGLWPVEAGHKRKAEGQQSLQRSVSTFFEPSGAHPGEGDILQELRGGGSVQHHGRSLTDRFLPLHEAPLGVEAPLSVEPSLGVEEPLGIEASFRRRALLLRPTSKEGPGHVPSPFLTIGPGEANDDSRCKRRLELPNDSMPSVRISPPASCPARLSCGRGSMHGRNLSMPLQLQVQARSDWANQQAQQRPLLQETWRINHNSNWAESGNAGKGHMTAAALPPPNKLHNMPRGENPNQSTELTLFPLISIDATSRPGYNLGEPQLWQARAGSTPEAGTEAPDGSMLSATPETDAFEATADEATSLPAQGLLQECEGNQNDGTVDLLSCFEEGFRRGSH